MARRKADPEVGKDILRKYLVGGTLYRHRISKAGKGRSEKTKLAGSFVAIPPPEGWPGGLPEHNGFRVRGK